MSGTFHEAGHLRLPLTSTRFGSGRGAKKAGSSDATLRVCYEAGKVYLQIGFSEVVLDTDARDQFARMWMEAERAAEAQAGVAP